MTEDLLEAGEMAAIQRLRDTDIRASLAGDAETLRSLLTEDGVLMPPGEPFVRGRKALGEKFVSMEAYRQATEVLEYREDFDETLIFGEYAVEWGVISGAERIRATGKVDRGAFKVMRILRRQADGSWKVHRAIWNDAPQDPRWEKAGPVCSY